MRKEVGSRLCIFHVCSTECVMMAYHSSNDAVSYLPAVLIILLKPELQKWQECPFSISKLNLLLLIVPHQHSQAQQGSYLYFAAAGHQHLHHRYEDPLQMCQQIAATSLELGKRASSNLSKDAEAVMHGIQCITKCRLQTVALMQSVN